MKIFEVWSSAGSGCGPAGELLGHVIAPNKAAADTLAAERWDVGERHVRGYSLPVVIANPPRESITLDGNSWCERLEMRVDALARHVAELEKTREADGKDWGEWRRETNENVDEITASLKATDSAIGSLENRDETRERDAKGLAESIMELRGRVIEAEEFRTESNRLWGSRYLRVRERIQTLERKTGDLAEKEPPQGEIIGGPLTGFDSQGHG